MCSSHLRLTSYFKFTVLCYFLSNHSCSWLTHHIYASYAFPAFNTGFLAQLCLSTSPWVFPSQISLIILWPWHCINSSLCASSKAEIPLIWEWSYAFIYITEIQHTQHRRAFKMPFVDCCHLYLKSQILYSITVISLQLK